MSSSNQITAYEGNDLKVICNVTGILSLEGYTPVLTVKTTKSSAIVLFEVTGGVVDLQLTFNVTDTQNLMNHNTYWYEVTIESVSKKYTLAQDIYKLKESLVYHETT
jgi:hypothetical protein